MTEHLVSMARAAQLAAKFAHVDAWVFDLDNTLYPPDCGLWPAIEERITHFLIEHSGLDGTSARALQRYYYHQHGTTLRGLVDEDGLQPHEFLEFVHDIDRSSLPPNPKLGAEIARLPGRKLIFTNGSRRHALDTIAQLGLTDLFEDAFDIVAAGLVPKPSAGAYDSFLAAHSVDPRRAAMFEDIAKNLVVPSARGMTTVLVTGKPGQTDHRQAPDRERPPGEFVDFVTDDLAGFLGSVNAAIGG
jgi:putative hydrolase of the HAD superfamily